MVSRIGTTFGEFVANERKLYEDEDNSKVASSLSQVTRYLRFVDIIHGRYAEANECCVQEFRRQMDEAKQATGTQELTADEYDQMVQVGALFERLHLEIEVFFLLAAITLDKIAQFVEDYFGPSRGLSLKSHNNWRKSATDFARNKRIQVPDEMPATMEQLQRDVVDHRDKQITHQRNPRTMFATYVTADGATGTAAMYHNSRQSDAYTRSPRVDDVVENLDAYVEQLMELIVSNRAKSRYNVRSG